MDRIQGIHVKGTPEDGVITTSVWDFNKKKNKFICTLQREFTCKQPRILDKECDIIVVNDSVAVSEMTHLPTDVDIIDMKQRHALFKEMKIDIKWTSDVSNAVELIQNWIVYRDDMRKIRRMKVNIMPNTPCQSRIKLLDT